MVFTSIMIHLRAAKRKHLALRFVLPAARGARSSWTRRPPGRTAMSNATNPRDEDHRVAGRHHRYKSNRITAATPAMSASVMAVPEGRQRPSRKKGHSGAMPLRPPRRPLRRTPRRPAAGAWASTGGGIRCPPAPTPGGCPPASRRTGPDPPDAGVPARGAAPRRFGHEGDAGQVAEETAVGLEDLPLAAYPLIQHAQLPAADGAPLRCAAGLPPVAGRCSAGSCSRSPSAGSAAPDRAPGSRACAHVRSAPGRPRPARRRPRWCKDGPR